MADGEAPTTTYKLPLQNVGPFGKIEKHSRTIVVDEDGAPGTASITLAVIDRSSKSDSHKSRMLAFQTMQVSKIR